MENWDVDTGTTEKLLTVKGQDGISEDDIINTLRKTGYKAEKI